MDCECGHAPHDDKVRCGVCNGVRYIPGPDSGKPCPYTRAAYWADRARRRQRFVHANNLTDFTRPSKRNKAPEDAEG